MGKVWDVCPASGTEQELESNDRIRVLEQQLRLAEDAGVRDGIINVRVITVTSMTAATATTTPPTSSQPSPLLYQNPSPSSSQPPSLLYQQPSPFSTPAPFLAGRQVHRACFCSRRWIEDRRETLFLDRRPWSWEETRGSQSRKSRQLQGRQR